jgi:Xaa-Pro aminopeptidase
VTDQEKPVTDSTATGTADNVKAELGTRPYDVDYPEAFKAFMRTGWGESPLAVSRRPEADHHAVRRSALTSAFSGETLVIPSGREKVRANDTLYTFRPGSDFMWLTGEHDPDSVLIIDPDGEATLYVRPRSPRDTDEFFRNAAYGELWVGRRHTLTEKSEQLGVRTAALSGLGDVLASLAPMTPPSTTRSCRTTQPNRACAIGNWRRRSQNCGW